MGTLGDQLLSAAPLLEGVDIREAERELLTKHEAAFYKKRPAYILHELASLAPAVNLFSHTRHTKEDAIFDKFKHLFKAHHTDGLEPSRCESIWKIRIGESEHTLGEHQALNWLSDAFEILDVPAFYRNLCNALQPYLPAGTFYYGYVKRESQRPLYGDFTFLIIFASKGTEGALRSFPDLEWIPLNAGKGRRLESLELAEQGNEGFVFRYRTKHTWLTGVVFIGGIILVVGTINALWSGAKLPISWLSVLLLSLVLGALGLLDHRNRQARLILSTEGITWQQGFTRLLPGFKSLVVKWHDVLRVWTKLESSDSSGTTETVEAGIDYSEAVFVTTANAEEVQITSYLERSEADYIKEKVESGWNKSRHATD